MVLAGDKWGRTAVLCLLSEEFMAHFLLLNINFHLSLWPSEAIWSSVAHQVCCVCSQTHTDCGQLIRKATLCPHLPCVSIMQVSLSPLLHTPFARFFSDLEPILLLSWGIIIGPFLGWKLSPSSSFPLLPFLCLEVCWFCLGLCVTFPLGARCRMWLY